MRPQEADRFAQLVSETTAKVCASLERAIDEMEAVQKTQGEINAHLLRILERVTSDEDFIVMQNSPITLPIQAIPDPMFPPNTSGGVQIGTPDVDPGNLS